MNKPQTLKGFRDFLPEEKRKRDWVASKLTEVFKLYGFEPLETPTLEYASLLLGKYGEEADKLVYTFEDKGKRSVGLRYDQTVPTARVLGQYTNDLPKYFRRFQIQNVFRADKPQKGRYREFTQCDIDIFGTTSPISDAEILACTYQAYMALGFDQIRLKLNDRETLVSTLEPFATEEVSVFSLIQSIDKLDKQTSESIEAELVTKGLSSEKAHLALTAISQAQPSNNIEEIMQRARQLGVASEALLFEPTLARGLDYYTGMIFEVILSEFSSGSLGGGGRYDKLIEDLSGQSMPAVGMAFGFDRTVEAAEALGLLPPMQQNAQVLVTLFDGATQDASLQAASELRAAQISTEVYPQIDKLGKQFKLANQKNIPYVLVIGEEEMSKGVVTLKDMREGNQQTLSLVEAIAILKSSA